MKTYGVVEVFETVQGEGFHAGTPAVFIRLAGCNLWSGNDERRAADAARSMAVCPLFCDTDFAMRERLSAAEVLERVSKFDVKPLIVVTGGEPLLQLDDELILALRRLPGTLAIETNGTVRPKFTPWARMWITLSPKRSRAETVLEKADELKLVWPAYDPLDWSDYPVPEGRRFLQPEAARSSRDANVERGCARYVVRNPQWRLSLQTHKILGVP